MSSAQSQDESGARGKIRDGHKLELSRGSCTQSGRRSPRGGVPLKTGRTTQPPSSGLPPSLPWAAWSRGSLPLPASPSRQRNWEGLGEKKAPSTTYLGPLCVPLQTFPALPPATCPGPPPPEPPASSPFLDPSSCRSYPDHPDVFLPCPCLHTPDWPPPRSLDLLTHPIPLRGRHQRLSKAPGTQQSLTKPPVLSFTHTHHPPLTPCWKP